MNKVIFSDMAYLFCILVSIYMLSRRLILFKRPPEITSYNPTEGKMKGRENALKLYTV